SETYTLNGGMLCTSNVDLVTLWDEAIFNQNGGTHIITNKLTLFGYRNRFSRDSAWYSLSNASLSARIIELQSSVLTVNNATVSVSDTLCLEAVYDKSLFGIVQLFSG